MAAICPNGHPLRSGHVLVGWSPCMRCPATKAAQRGLRGHRTVQCLDCKEKLGEEMVWYDPPCTHGGGHPNRA